MDQKGHMIDQKGLKMYEKRKKIPNRARNDVLVLNEVKNGQKQPYNRQKRFKHV